MKRFYILLIAMFMVFGLSTSAMALLAVGDNLSIATGNGVSGLACTSGSCFSMEVAPNFFVWTNISGNNGINIGAIQPATGSHNGPPNGSESPGIDAAWSFFGNTGMHQTTSPITEISPGVVDMTGWDVTWNFIATIPMGGDTANFPVDTGLGALTVSGSNYTIDYAGHVPLGSPSNFGGVQYAVHLEGVITSAVPEPASLLLIGSGLVGILGLASKKK